MKIFHNQVTLTLAGEKFGVKLKSVSKKNLDDYKCTRCLRYSKKFSRENMMIPCLVPTELQGGLSQCEEMLIARAFLVMLVYMKPRY